MSRSAEVAFVRADSLVRLSDLVAHRGVAMDDVLRRAELRVDLLDGVPRPIGVVAAARLIGCAAHAVEDDALGTALSQLAGVDALLEYGRAVLREPTVAKLLDACSSLIATHTRGAELAWRVSADSVRWTYRLPPEVRVGREATSQLAVGLMAVVMRRAVSESWAPQEAFFEQGRPSNVSLLEEVYGCSLRFKAESNGLVFDADVLERPLAGEVANGATGPGPLTLDLMAEDFPALVERIIAAYLPLGAPVEDVARACGLSRRTLQRLLQAEHVSFAALRERARLAEALRLLARTDAKIIEVALDLGYDDPTNFAHAFRRWTGRSPSQFRRLARANGTQAAAEPLRPWLAHNHRHARRVPLS